MGCCPDYQQVCLVQPAENRRRYFAAGAYTDWSRATYIGKLDERNIHWKSFNDNSANSIETQLNSLSTVIASLAFSYLNSETFSA